MLEIKNLYKHFGGVQAIEDCSFQVKAGTITALIGPNGAGKSTVFNLIFGIVRPDKGDIFFGGKKITNLSPEKISNIGFSRVFQQASLFNNLTVKENLLLAIDNEDQKFWRSFLRIYSNIKEKDKKVSEVLKMVDMEKFENYTARDLSYGQKRLVELARAILNPHTILVLDEPVAGVNPKLRQKISEVLKNLKKSGDTVLLIEHDMDFTLGISDEVVVMEKGAVIVQDSPENIKNNPKVLEAYLGE